VLSSSGTPAVGRATLADVAARAGVSIGTASKALNGRGRLAEATRARVLAAAEELAFRPNSLAKGLLTGRSYTVGLVTTDHVGRFSLPVLLGAEDALGAGKMAVFLCDTRGDPIRERHHIAELVARRIDGLIVTGRRTDTRPSLTDRLAVPVVYAYAPSDDPADISVMPDEAGGARLATEHLVALGRTRIAHVTGPERHHSSRLRAEHALRVLDESGLELAGGRVHYGEWSEQWGRQAAHIVLRTRPDCDAIFCGSDQIARGVADGLRDAGRTVPDDVALVGFDNWDAMVDGCRPPLTTVDMGLTDIGRLAARKLLDAIDGTPAPGVHLVPCQLIPRDSTAPTPARTT
jgi:LacI family transcriptional regulator